MSAASAFRRGREANVSFDICVGEAETLDRPGVSSFGEVNSCPNPPVTKIKKAVQLKR